MGDGRGWGKGGGGQGRGVHEIHKGRGDREGADIPN